MAELQRNLGLSAVITISLGAMIGSGIFVLPGLGAKVAGPGVILAYFLAGLVVLPAAISKSEMATAMPKAGGAYLFIDRAMGPLVGTVAGFGVWFALVFKSAFALVGLGGYLKFFLDIPVLTVAVVLAVALSVVNMVGVKQSAGLQTVIVLGVLAVLGVFVASGASGLERSAVTPFLPEGIGGLLSATGLVFVSYAGVTKVASVAEEVKDPESVLPRAILRSVTLMLVLYPAVVWVIVGNLAPGDLAGNPTPVSAAAEVFMGRFGAGLVSATAVLALISMANAGLLSSSRYPFAMARNRMAPAGFAAIYQRTGTPVASIALTGGVMIALILFVPLIELAKLASAFQVLVFSLINLSLIAFRESNPTWYRPTFRSPLYPWLQFFGIGASLLLLTQLGLISILGSIGIVVVGVTWYRLFGHSRTSHESALLDTLRLRSIGPLVETTRRALASHGRDHVVIPVDGMTTNTRLRELLRIAQAVTAEDGRITLARVDRIPRGALRWRHSSLPRPDDPFRLEAKKVADELGMDIAIVRPRGNDARQALVQYANRHAVDLILGVLHSQGTRHRSRFDPTWIQDRAPCDVMMLGKGALDTVSTIMVLGAGSPNDVPKIDTAYRLGYGERAEVRLLHVLDQNATEPQYKAIEDYHDQLLDLSPVDIDSYIDSSADLIGTIEERQRGADLVIMGASRTGIGTELSRRITDAIEGSVLVVHAAERSAQSWGQRILHRLIY